MAALGGAAAAQPDPRGGRGGAEPLLGEAPTVAGGRISSRYGVSAVRLASIATTSVQDACAQPGLSLPEIAWVRQSSLSHHDQQTQNLSWTAEAN